MSVWRSPLLGCVQNRCYSQMVAQILDLSRSQHGFRTFGMLGAAESVLVGVGSVSLLQSIIVDCLQLCEGCSQMTLRSLFSSYSCVRTRAGERASASAQART